MTLLAGYNVDNGSTLVGGNPLQPRAWKFPVVATGNADRLVFKAASTGSYKFSIHTLPTIGGIPTTQLATTVDVSAVINNVYTVNLSSVVALTNGQAIAVAVKTSTNVFNFFKGNTGSVGIALSGTDSAFSDPMDAPWSNTGGSTSSLPYLYLESSTVSITGLDKLEADSLSTLTLNDAGFVATSVKITSNAVTKTIAATGTATTFTFTPPSWVDNATALKYGACNIVANNGSTDTTSFSASFTLPAPYAYVTLTSVSANSVDKITGLAPAFKIGTQVIYNTLHGTVYANGEWNDFIQTGSSSNHTGNTILAYLDPDDNIARIGSITLINGNVRVNLTLSLSSNSTSPKYDGLYPLGNRP